MRSEEHQQGALYELCALVLSTIRPPPLPPPGTLALSPRTRQRQQRWPEVSPLGVAALLLGASVAMMLGGSLSFMIGFMLMPWVLGMVVVLYLVGVVSTISDLGRSLLFPSSARVSKGRKPSPKEMPRQLFSKVPIM